MAKPIIYKKDTKYDVSYINDKGESKTIEYIPEEDLSIAKIITDIKSKNKDYLKLGSIKLSENYDLLRKENNQMSVEDNNLNNSLQSESTTKTTKEFRIMDGDKVLKTFSADEENKGYEEMRAMGRALKDAGKEDNLVYKEFRVKNKLKEDLIDSNKSVTNKESIVSDVWKEFWDNDELYNLMVNAYNANEDLEETLKNTDWAKNIKATYDLDDSAFADLITILCNNWSKNSFRFINATNESKQLSESRPDKDAAKAKMFRDSRKKLNMPDEYFTTKEQVLDYLNKCDDETDVMNVNEHISDMELRNYMLDLGFNFSKENGKYPSNAPEEFKKYMIDGVSKYNKVTESVSENKLDKNVKDAFIEEYPDDPFGQDIKSDITFKDVLDGLKREDNIYDIIGVDDSVVRENIFSMLANLMNVDYDYVYKLWLYGERKAEIKEEATTSDYGYTVFFKDKDNVIKSKERFSIVRLGDEIAKKEADKLADKLKEQGYKDVSINDYGKAPFVPEQLNDYKSSYISKTGNDVNSVSWVGQSGDIDIIKINGKNYDFNINTRELVEAKAVFEELEPINESNINESFFNLYDAMDQQYGIRKLTPKELIDFMNNLKEAHRLSDKDYETIVEFANKYQELINNCGYESNVLHEDNDIESEIEDDFEELEADDIEDQADTITEDSEDLNAVKDNIEQAIDSIDNPTPEDQLGMKSTNSSINVLDADEKSAIDGYEAFLAQAKEILPEALYSVLEKEVNEIISDEEDHEDKLAAIKSAFHLDNIFADEANGDEVEESLTEEKTIATYKDNSSLVKTIQADNGKYFNYYYDDEKDQDHWSSKAGPFETSDEAAEMVKKHRPLANKITESIDERMNDIETTYKQLEDKASKEAHDYLNEQGIPLSEADIDDYDNIEIAVDEALADYQPDCIEEYIDKTGDNIDWDYSLSIMNPEIIKITINR